MPVYDYRCSVCGDFEVWRSLAECNLPVHCQSCEAPAKRVFSPPNLSLSGRLSLKENKEPRLIKREQEPEKPKNQMHKGGRPWMIGHAPPVF